MKPEVMILAYLQDSVTTKTAFKLTKIVPYIEKLDETGRQLILYTSIKKLLDGHLSGRFFQSPNYGWYSSLHALENFEKHTLTNRAIDEKKAYLLTYSYPRNLHNVPNIYHLALLDRQQNDLLFKNHSVPNDYYANHVFFYKQGTVPIDSTMLYEGEQTSALVLAAKLNRLSAFEEILTVYKINHLSPNLNDLYKVLDMKDKEFTEIIATHHRYAYDYWREPDYEQWLNPKQESQTSTSKPFKPLALIDPPELLEPPGYFPSLDGGMPAMRCHAEIDDNNPLADVPSEDDHAEYPPLYHKPSFD